jgi:enoyl-CoA hydratase
VHHPNLGEHCMDFSAYRHLDVTRDGAVVTVTLNRPEVKNAIGEVLHHELSTIFWDLESDASCEVIILTGTGDAFCAGGDLAWVLSMAGDPVAATAAGRDARRIQTTMLDLEKPIIAKVRGPAMGLGCSLALFCDFVYATPNAAFADPHVSVGLVAGDGGPVIWPQLIGYARARRYLLTGDAIRGSDAAEIGLITEAVPDEQLDEVVAAMAQRLLGGAKHAIKWTKASINAGLKLMATSIMDKATAAENLSQMTDDNRIALEAFLAKEKPKFIGT